MLNTLFRGKVEGLRLCRMLSTESADEPPAGYAGSLAVKLGVLPGWCPRKFLSRGMKGPKCIFPGRLGETVIALLQKTGGRKREKEAE